VTDVCAVVLAAGEGRRLRPLTDVYPKALCPVANVPLIDRALAGVAAFGFAGPDRVAVNTWYLASAVEAHVDGRAHLARETGAAPLGSAGGLAALREWIDGRHVLAGNADAYLAGGDLGALLRHWDGEHVRMLGVPAGSKPAEFGTHRFAGFTLLPWRWVARLAATPADLVRAVWRPAEALGQLRVVSYGGHYLDSGTPADYLAANLDAAADAALDAGLDPADGLIAPEAFVKGTVAGSVIGGHAEVYGTVEHSVVLPGAYVGPDEHLVSAIRFGYAGTIDARPLVRSAGGAHRAPD
jgi:N-acetyl-alpha-D-muramate 1-phosphate uridylyltransferase